jgi:hypothetical protein
VNEDKVTQPSNPDDVVDIDGCTALYVELRDKIAALKAELTEQMKPYRKGIEDLDAILLKALQDQGAKTIKTASGTVYQRIERSATLKDRKAFSEYVKSNQEWDLIEWRPAKVAVFEHMEKKAVEVPGVNTSAYMTIGVRRGANSSQESDDE